ncbi:MAG: T9SS type A sorting domain-containing protein [Bacteroidota bacterium]
MKINQILSFLFVLLSPFIGSAQSLNCDLTYLTAIEDFDVYQHDSSGAILYRAKMSIDADGSPRAYGPNDSGLDWTANAGYPGNWWGIVTDVNGDPVIQGSGDPYPGMYVSTTSLVQSGYLDTNPLRYVDSENIPYIAMPSALQSLGNISMGDLAYVKNITNGNVSYAYLADTGPGGKLGEGSMYLATALGINNSPRTGGTSLQIIDYIVFPQSGFGQGTHLTAMEIDSIGLMVLTAAGGIGLPGCLDAQFPSLDCSSAVPLTDGITYSGASSSAASIISTFGCNTWTETGPERVHSIVPCGEGSITATLSNFTGDLDVYILGSCDPYDCLGTVFSSSATYTNVVAGQTYYIVVDADDGSGSAYDILVTLNLTGNGTAGTDTQTACDTYTWIDGNTYTSSDTTATHTLVGGNSVGCDSVVTLNLTINSSSSGIDTQIACETYTWIDGLTYTSSNNTATHTLVGGNAVGCDSVISLNLTIGAVDTAVIQTNDAIIASQGGAIYQWIDCGNGNSAIVGETNQSYVVTTNGDYAVIISSGSCSDTSTCVTMIVTGLGESLQNNTFNIYPNPAKDHFTISFNESIDRYHAIRIRNFSGQVVLELIAFDDQINVDMSSFAKGVYVVSVASSEGVEKVKVLKL